MSHEIKTESACQVNHQNEILKFSESDMKILKILRVIVKDPQLHAGWLNGLSYLEYRGFRKIVKFHSSSETSLTMLQHCNEEVRHAVFFKRQAVRMGGASYDRFNESTILREAAFKRYFFEIDSSICHERLGLKTAPLNSVTYLLVTWLVEVRAIEVYRIYELVLREQGAEFSLGALIREEEHHLKALGERAKLALTQQSLNIQDFREFEEREFERLWRSIESQLLRGKEVPPPSASHSKPKPAEKVQLA